MADRYRMGESSLAWIPFVEYGFPCAAGGYRLSYLEGAQFQAFLSTSSSAESVAARAIEEIRFRIMKFAEMSGLHVNPNKSTIILSKAVRSERMAILDFMGFQEAVLPIKYLGVPLIASRLTVANCQPLIDRFNSRLAGYAKVSWLQVCKPKEEGGLGIRRVLFMNQALMLRLIWRILQRDPRSIWVAWVLRYRLRSQTLWTSSVTAAPWCWWKLLKLCPLLRDGLDYRVGDGCQFKLWGDIWHPRGPLLLSFPRGPRITGLPADSMMQAVIQQGQWSWPSSTDLDIQEIVSDLPLIYPHQTDEIKWKFNKGILWASRRWRGTHLLNMASRALLAAIVYHIWGERNSRRFLATSSSADSVAARAIDEVRYRIMSEHLQPSLQSYVLHRVWKIPWDGH
ncbi:UNVERIFIED_CONTAM: hypothetical protein Sradi_7216300 [Sesamum radiatum]|uniref:Reverse transcriptase n=1 Tax=Sesamum radiatum TaxID=300843 RepID=A0AAW2IQI9_SESRA